MKLYIIEKKEGRKWLALKSASHSSSTSVKLYFTVFYDEREALEVLSSIIADDPLVRLRISKWEKVK